jgi:hypothetical protein
VPAAQFEGSRWGAAWKLAALSGAGVLALAWTTPARADDQTPSPPPLMVAKAAVIAQDEPDATVPADVSVAETDSTAAPAPDPVPVRIVAPTGWKLAAKAPVVHRAAPAHVRVVVAHPAPAPVISAPARPVHPARPHHTAKRVHSRRAAAPRGWYQLRSVQYRVARADTGNVRPSLAAAPAQEPAASAAVLARQPVQKARTLCELRLHKCLQLCSWNATDNGPENGRWIGVCISSLDLDSQLDRLHELFIQRLWSIALDDRGTVAARQYQCFGTQYQSGACVSARPPRAKAADTHVSGRPVPAVATRVVHVESHPGGRVLAAVATRRTPPAKTVVRSSPSPSPSPQPRVRREVAPAPATATQSDDSSDWLLRSLVVLIAIAMLALVLAAGSELPSAGAAVTGVRTRLASKGLSSSRIDLGRESPNAPPRDGGIPYRD